MMDLKFYTLSVCEIAKRAGAYIRGERQKFSLENVERKHAHDYVSYVDKGSEKLIVTALKELLPEAGFITEEGLAGHDQEQMLWVVDPLDGTTNFIHNYAPYAVSIALLKGKEILIGVVYEICTDACYYAWQHGGAYVNGARLQVSSQKIQDALLCLQFPYNSDAYKLCYVAEGTLDGYMEQYIGQWDYMAGSLIVMESGGKVTNYEGAADFTQGNSVIASNKLIHTDLLEAIRN